MSGSEDTTSDRVQNLVDELGDELLDLEATYKNARSALVGEDLERRAEADELLASSADRHELTHQISTLKTEMARQSEELAARDEHVKALQAQTSELEDRLGRNSVEEVRIADLEGDLRKERRELERFKTLLEARVVERDEIAAQIRLLEVEKNQLRRDVETAADELELVAGERVEMRKRIQRLEAEAVRVRRDHEARQVQLEASGEERAELQRKLGQADELNTDRVNRIGEIEGLLERRANEIAHLKKRNNRLEVNLAAQSEAATHLELRTAERDKLSRRVEILESELTAQTTEAGASKKALELLASRTAERDTLDQKVAELESRLGEASEQISKTRGANQMLESRTAERNRLERRVAELEAELRSERAQVAEWRETADLIAAITDERDALKRHVDVLKAQIDNRSLPREVLGRDDPTAALRDDEPVNASSSSADAASRPRSSLSARIAELEARMTEQLDDFTRDAERGEIDRTQGAEVSAAAVRTADSMRGLVEEGFRDAVRSEPAPRETAREPDDRGVDTWDDADRYDDDIDDDEVDAAYDDGDVDDEYDDLVDDYDDYDDLADDFDDYDDDHEDHDDDDHDDHVHEDYDDVDYDDDEHDDYDDEIDEGQASATIDEAPRWNDDVVDDVDDYDSGYDEFVEDDFDDGPADFVASAADGRSGDGADAKLVDVADESVSPPSQATLQLYRQTLSDLEAGKEPEPMPKGRLGFESRRRIKLPSNVRPDSPEAATHLVRVNDVVLIVDGYAASSVTKDPKGDRRRAVGLIEKLNDLAMKNSGSSFEVVFDGNALEPDASLGSRERVRVRFARGGVGVGEVLMRLCDTYPSNRALAVVSSDRRVREAARRARLNLLTVEQLLALIDS